MNTDAYCQINGKIHKAMNLCYYDHCTGQKQIDWKYTRLEFDGTHFDIHCFLQENGTKNVSFLQIHIIMDSL